MILKSVLCIDFPPLLKLELQDSYTNWCKKCIFSTFNSAARIKADLIILPAEKLIDFKKSSRPIIAFGSVEMLEVSFMHGAVDYLKNPWYCSELLIRSQPFLEGLTLQKENVTLLYRKGSLLINNKFIELSPYQSRLMMILMKYYNSFVGYSLLKEILEIKSDNDRKSIHVHMHKIRRILRTELPDIYGNSLYIKNSSSMGYALILPVDNLCKIVEN